MSQIIYIVPEGLPAPKIFTMDATSLSRAKKKQFCRLCLCEGYDFIKVLSDVMQPHQLELARNIKECVSIEIKARDQLPDTICHSCHRRVSEWAEFKDICTKSNELMLSELARGEADASPSCEDNEPDGNSLDDDDKKSIQDVTDDTEFFKALCRVEAEMGFKQKEDVGEDEGHQCQVCFEVFSTYLDYLDHQDSHDGEVSYNCNLCPEIFSRRRDLAYHERNHPIPCYKCGKMIGRQYMTPHMILHSDKFVCPHCKSHFMSNCQMEEHISSVHLNIKRHVCDTCGKSYNTKTIFDGHLKSHSKKRPYECEKCPYAAKTALVLYNHMSVHAEDKCRCKLCPKVFKSMRNLTDHMRRTHSEDKKRKLMCPVCDVGFVQRYHLRLHVERKHNGVKIEEEEKHTSSTVQNANGLMDLEDTNEEYKVDDFVE